MTPLLFSPVSIKSMELRNRVVVSPMAQYAAMNGVVNDWHFGHLHRFAISGAGLICVEATKVERRGMGTVGDTGLWNDAQEAAMADLVAGLKPYGAKLAVQINHAGRKAGTLKPWEGWGPLDRSAPLADGGEHWEVIGPSPVPYRDGWPVPREMTQGDIDDVVSAWSASARRADRAGFDALEIHAAHGYLIHQFLSEAANRRADAYGGSLTARMRFGREVIEAVRAAWPEEKPLFMRISARDEAGWTLDQSVEFARMAGELGVDVIDCSSGGIAPKNLTAFEDESRPGYQVPYAREIREKTGLPTVAVGLIREARHAEEILQAGDADLIAIGREMLYNPAWALHAAGELGVENRFEMVPPNHRHFLSRRDVAPREKLAK